MSSTPTPPSTTNEDGEETVESLKKRLERSEAARLKLREGLAAMREKALNTQKLVGKYKELTEHCSSLETTNQNLQAKLSSTAGPSQTNQERERQLKTEYELQISVLQESMSRVEEKLKRTTQEVALQVQKVAQEQQRREDAERASALKEADLAAKERKLRDEVDEAMLQLETKAVLKERKLRQELEQTLSLEIETLKKDAEKTKRMEKARLDNERDLRELSERRLVKQTMDLQTTREEVVALKAELTNAIMVARNMQENFRVVQQSVHNHWTTMQDLIGASGLSEIPVTVRTKRSSLSEARCMDDLPSSTHASLETPTGDLGVALGSNGQSANGGGVQATGTSVSSGGRLGNLGMGALGEKRKAVSNPEGQPPGTRSRLVPAPPTVPTPAVIPAPPTAHQIVSNSAAPLISPRVESPAQMLRIKMDRARVLVQKLDVDPPNFHEVAHAIHKIGGEELVSTLASELSRRISQCGQGYSGSPVISTADPKDSWLVPWCKPGDKPHRQFAAVISLVGALAQVDVYKGLPTAVWKELCSKVLTFTKTSSGSIGEYCASAACAGHICALLNDRQLFTVFIVDLLSLVGRSACSMMPLLLSLLGSWPQILLLKGKNDFLDRMIRSVIMAMCGTLMKPDGEKASRHPLDVFAARTLIQMGCDNGWWKGLQPTQDGTTDPVVLIQHAGKGFMTEIGNVLRDFTSMFESAPSPDIEGLWELMFHQCCETLALAIISMSVDVAQKLVTKRMFPWLKIAGQQRFPRVMEVFHRILFTLLKLSPQPEVALDLCTEMLKVIDWQKQPSAKPNQLCLVTQLVEFLQEGQSLYPVSNSPESFGRKFVELADTLDAQSKALSA